jgi:predicted metalloprotease with PDZ domain
VTPGGPADLAGLRVHDKVLSVNGISCVNVDHYEAVGILKVQHIFSLLKMQFSNLSERVLDFIVVPVVSE